ncbi:UNVERIFIED_CONTAM: hypothetical protein FKN15_020800 [Acipenser sinensis]
MPSGGVLVVGGYSRFCKDRTFRVGIKEAPPFPSLPVPDKINTTQLPTPNTTAGARREAARRAMDPQPPKGKNQGRLLVSSNLDAKDELEERLDRCAAVVTSLINGLSEREANDALTAHVCKGAQQHEEVCLGLFSILLAEPAQAQRSYRDLTLVNRDGMNIVLIKINQLLMEKFLKLQDTCRTQLVWLVKELVKSAVLGADGVCMTLMKQIIVSPPACRDAHRITTCMSEWVLKSGMLVAMSVYTYLRLIVDHHSTPQHQTLRQKEVDFCVGLLRERFMDCYIMGRDLVRLLQNVARIPEMELLWRDLLHNPQALSPQFTGILQLLTSRTSRKFLACRLTPDMETKLLFMTSRVRFGQQKRYQDWFQRQYLSTPDSQSLRCDLIRYICGVVHPSNEVLSSDILPRWAIIGWLLTTCTPQFNLASRSLCFTPLPEPAILVMHHSMKPHPAITATLLDFMCRIIPNFFPSLEGHVRHGVFNSLTFIVEKRVLAHLAPLFDNPKLDRELRAMLRERNLCQMQEDNSGFSVLLDMLAELYQKQPKIGYHLLYYLKASKAAAGKMLLYESFAQATALGDLHTCLMMDMKACQEDDVRLLCYLTPSIYSEFPDETLRSGELLNMIVAVIDSTQVSQDGLRSSSSKLAQLTLEQILEHLDNLRLSLSNTKQSFFNQTPILQALLHVQASCDEAHKMRFSDLFSLAEDYEDSSSKPIKSRRKAAMSSPRSRKGPTQPMSNEEETGSSSASDEEDTKPKASKRKRKGSTPVGSDSD